MLFLMSEKFLFSEGPKNSNTKNNKNRKNGAKKMRNKIKRVARNAASAVASQYIGSANTQMARVAINSIGRQIKGQKVPRPLSNPPTILGRCASRLLQSYISPFNVDNVCIPTPPGLPTRKIRTYIRGVATIGLKGFGFVAVAPCLCRDRPAVFYSSATYNLDNLSAPSTDLAWNATPSQYTPNMVAVSGSYGADDFDRQGIDPNNPYVEGRICSASLSVQYAGRAVDQQGLIVGYLDLASSSVLGDAHLSTAAGNGYTLTQLMSLAYADVEMNKGKMTMPIIPDSQASDDFLEQNTATSAHYYPYSGRTSYLDGSSPARLVIGTCPAVIAFSGTVGASVYFEYVQHTEVKGSLVPSSMMTGNDIDEVGYTVVRDMVSKARNLQQGTSKPFISCIRDVMRQHNVIYGEGYRTR